MIIGKGQYGKTTNKAEIRRCPHCKNLPTLIKDKHNLLQKTIWAITCKNPKCRHQPATADVFTKNEAIKQWNNGFVTSSLF